MTKVARKAARSPTPPAGQRRVKAPRPLLALTTGQAARYCLVSADTIVKWIATGRLEAQRTAGGQYRIRCDELRAFMTALGMRTDQLDSETGHSLACWEFFRSRGPGGGLAAACTDCAVRKSGAAVCHEVRPLIGATPNAPSCAECDYLAACRDLYEEKR